MENEVKSLPQTPPIISPPTNWSKILLFFVLGLIVVAGSTFTGILIGKNQTPSKQPITAQTKAPPVEPVVKINNGSPIINPIIVSPYGNDSSISLPLVVYNLSAEDYATYYKAITDKVVMPFLDYYLKGGGGEEKDIKILVINRAVNQGYEFAFDSFTSSGKPGESGLINNNPKTGELNFWFPHCMGNCALSKPYITKYPEVSKLAAPLPSE